jgi:CRP-like cAMP-binding protein
VKNITLQSIKDLFPSATERSYDKGQIICYQGDQPQFIFFVVSGHVRYYDIDEEGNEKILHLIGPNNIFPMLYAFSVTKDVGAFYSALDKTDIIAVPLEAFRSAAETNLVFANSLIHWFLTEINQQAERISSLEKTDARIKVLYALKNLATNFGEPKGTWQQINLALTHQFIADFTGLARETVSAIMRDLDVDKIIRQRKGHKLEIKRSQLNSLK